MLYCTILYYTALSTVLHCIIEIFDIDFMIVMMRIIIMMMRIMMRIMMITMRIIIITMMRMMRMRMRMLLDIELSC